MATIYYPSCKYTAFSPAGSARISEIVRERYGFTVAGCCREGHFALTADDTAVTVCNTCAAICAEDSPAKGRSIWEVLDEDDTFPLPDLHGAKMALQDCWRAYDRREVQQAVRSLLQKMQVSIVELPENREHTRYCGTTLYAPLHKANGEFAPDRFIKRAPGLFVPHSKEQQEALMREHCRLIPVEPVVCYCVPCTQGIQIGGKKGIHLMDLILGLEG